MALCEITGTLYLPDGEPAKFYTVYLTRTDKRVVRDYNGAVVPQMVKVQTAQDGSVDFSILTGSYNGIARPSDTSGGSTQYSFTFNVPDAASALFQDCIDAVAPPSPQPVWYDKLNAEISDISDIALSNEESLEGSPWQVVATDAESGKAVAQELGPYHVMDLDAGPGDYASYYVPGYAGTGKANTLFATTSIIDYGHKVVPLRNPDRTINSTDPTAAEHLATKRYVDTAAGRASWAIAPNYTVNSDPLPSPSAKVGQRSCLAFGYGSHALHTNPGPNNNGGSEAIGNYSYANGLHCVAVGTLAKAGPLLANEDPNPEATGLMFATALGNNAQSTASHAEALGCRSKAAHFMSVALGTESVTSGEREVSVGNATVKRRITNAADPDGPQDAATKAYVDRALDVQVFATYAEALAYSQGHPNAIVFSEEAAP